MRSCGSDLHCITLNFNKAIDNVPRGALDTVSSLKCGIRQIDGTFSADGVVPESAFRSTPLNKCQREKKSSRKFAKNKSK